MDLDLDDPTISLSTPLSNSKKMKIESDSGDYDDGLILSQCEINRNKSKMKSFILNGKFFGEVQKLQKNLDIIAVCQVCKKQIRGSIGVTSNFTKHLKRVHPDSYTEYTSLKQRKTPGNRQTQFDKRLLEFIYDLILPLSIVENKSFVKLFEGTDLKVVSGPKVMSSLNERYKKMLDTIKLAMKSANYFCTTADIWCGTRTRRSFFGYTCHWLDQNFKRCSVALACRRFPGVDSEGKIADLISEINAEFGLNDLNVVATIIENGSNYVKIFKELGIDNFNCEDNELPEFCEEDFNYALPNQVRCACHTMTLMASTDYLKYLKADASLYEMHLKVFKICNTLWIKNKYPKSAEHIDSILNGPLIVPVVTRWNSTYDAVFSLLSHKSKLHELCTKLSVDQFSENDLQYLEEYCAVMKPLAEAMDHLQQDENIFFGDLIPTLVTLKTKLKRLKSCGEMTLLKGAIEMLEESLINRFNTYLYLETEANNAIIAAILRPTIKLKWLKGLSDIPHEHRDLTMDSISKLVRNNAEQYAYDMGMKYIFEEEALNHNDGRENYYDFDIDEESCASTSHSMTVSLSNSTYMKKEYSSYISDSNVGIEMLDKYPVLKKLSIKLNTPLTSSGPVERLFSFADLVNTPMRSTLSDLHFEQLVLLKANSSFIKSH